MGRITRKLLIVILVFSLISAGFVGCIPDDGLDNGQDKAPDLPPNNSMMLDVPRFFHEPGSGLIGDNFKNAAARVVLVEAAVGTILAAPAAVFAAAQSVPPKKQEDGSWLWSQKVTVFGYTYGANLVGQMRGTRTSWSMRVSNDRLTPPLEDFLWYSGESKMEGSLASGTWRFFDLRTPNEMNEVGTIDWMSTGSSVGFPEPDEEKNELVFTITDVRSPYLGDELLQSFEATDEGAIGLIKFYDASERMTAEIRFNVYTFAGSLRVPNYNDGRWACWDERLQDIKCPFN